MRILREIVATGEPVYIVKLDYVNGLHKEYSYFDLGLANTAYSLACQARAKAIGFDDLYDEGGRKASIDGAKLQSVELVDFGAETVSAITLIKELQAIQAQHGMLQQPEPPQRRLPPPDRPVERDDAPEYSPAIGKRPAFAS